MSLPKPIEFVRDISNSSTRPSQPSRAPYSLALVPDHRRGARCSAGADARQKHTAVVDGCFWEAPHGESGLAHGGSRGTSQAGAASGCVSDDAIHRIGCRREARAVIRLDGEMPGPCPGSGLSTGGKTLRWLSPRSGIRGRSRHRGATGRPTPTACTLTTPTLYL